MSSATHKISDSINIKLTDTFEFRVKQDATNILKSFKMVVSNQQLVLYQKKLIIQQIVLFIVVLIDFLSDIQVLILSTLIEYQKLSLLPRNSGLFELTELAPNVKRLRLYQVFFVETIQYQIIHSSCFFKLQHNPTFHQNPKVSPTATDTAFHQKPKNSKVSSKTKAQL